MKKIVSILILIVSVFILVSCDQTPQETHELADQLDIVLDGVIDETAYEVIPSRITGIKGSVKVQYAASKEGIYFGITVTDSNHQISTGGIESSDYIGLVVDAQAVPRNNDGISEGTHLFRYDVRGRYSYSTGNDYGAWEEIVALGRYEEVLIEEDQPNFAFEVLEDVEYVAEFFFSWELLGISANEVENKNQIMYYIEHRDMNVDIHADANILSPSSYNVLTLLGDRKGSNMPIQAPEITIDGVMDEAIWEEATITNQGNFKQIIDDTMTAGDFVTKAFFGEHGLYIGVFVEETDIQAPYGTGQAYRNAGMEIRIFSFDDQGLPQTSLKLLFDVFGPQWHETAAGGLSSSFALLAEYAYDIQGTINDDSDQDVSWGFEIFIPYEQLDITHPQTQYIHILHAVGSFDQNNILPEDYRNNPDNSDGSGGVTWDNALNYPIVRKE